MAKTWQKPNHFEIEGSTQGLTTSDVDALQRLHALRQGERELVSRQIALTLATHSDRLHRKIAVFIDRKGRVQRVMLGDAHRVFLADVGRARVGKTRLRGLRLIVTHLATAGSGEGQHRIILDDELTDLEKLRLDMIVALEIQPGGLIAGVQYAHILPSKGQKKQANIEISEILPLDEHRDDYGALIFALEKELRDVAAATTTTARSPAILVHVSIFGEQDDARRDEMLDLCASAGAEIVHVVDIRRQRLDARTLVGKGKLEEISLLALDYGADYVIFDRDLSAGQSRVISQVLECKIVDRTQLILDIFAQRASSLDGKLQVELAQLKYTLPLLANRNTAMSRLAGGIGGRGPGETKLELNRRRIRDQINYVQRQLNKRQKHRQLQRKKRQQMNIPVVSLVGYTNAGKSTLLNALTDATVLAKDQLFATLDTTTRRLKLPNSTRQIVLTDTVGFISELPNDLIAAFKATLEELQDANVLLHILDASSSHVYAQHDAVEAILAELGLSHKTRIVVLNKTDLVSAAELNDLCRHFEGSFALSALEASTAKGLLEAIGELFPQNAT